MIRSKKTLNRVFEPRLNAFFEDDFKSTQLCNPGNSANTACMREFLKAHEGIKYGLFMSSVRRRCCSMYKVLECAVGKCPENHEIHSNELVKVMLIFIYLFRLEFFVVIPKFIFNLI
jgi:hypothetical protein